MSLEDVGAEMLAAALAGNVNALVRSLRMRREAIMALTQSEESAARMEEALRAGEATSRALFALKQRIGADSARLTRLRTAIEAGLGGSGTVRSWVG